ncbi:hypothetical protein AN958_03769 [Leucoagaricus sp. SymC.cos]|nr:hypothetical protein AN958_03769 [Leucoagaricus sp. SymC.cos]
MTIEASSQSQPPNLERKELTAADVPLRKGPPTKEELIAHYPADFTWEQLKTFVNSGDLGLLKRNRKLQQRYHEWSEGIVERYGSLVNYLLNHRLQWGKPDTLSLLTSALDEVKDRIANGQAVTNGTVTPPITSTEVVTQKELPLLPPDAPEIFSVNTPAEYISIIQNDWPYSVPTDVEHTLIWTRIPIYHHTLVPPSIKARIEQDGLWGFTGDTSPPPDPVEHLPAYISTLAEWGITLDTMVVSKRGTEQEEELVRRAGSNVHEFVKKRWNEDEWETAWFVNPPRLQSVPGLAHIHIFAKQKVHTTGSTQ